MAEFVITGGKFKRTNARFGGNTAHRQHEDEGKTKALVCKARRLAEDKLTATLIEDYSDWDAAPERRGETCACTGFEKPHTGVVREGNISLTYSRGKLVAAHCG